MTEIEISNILLSILKNNSWAVNFSVLHNLILMLRSARRSCGSLRPQPKTHNRPVFHFISFHLGRVALQQSCFSRGLPLKTCTIQSTVKRSKSERPQCAESSGFFCVRIFYHFLLSTLSTKVKKEIHISNLIQ